MILWQWAPAVMTLSVVFEFSSWNFALLTPDGSLIVAEIGISLFFAASTPTVESCQSWLTSKRSKVEGESSWSAPAAGAARAATARAALRAAAVAVATMARLRMVWFPHD